MEKRYCTLSSLYLLCTSAVSNKPWLVTDIVLWLSTVLCPVFVANPRPEREGYIHSPVERLDAPAQLSRVYPTSCTCDNIPGFPPRIVESLGMRLLSWCGSRKTWEAWEQGYPQLIKDGGSMFCFVNDLYLRRVQVVLELAVVVCLTVWL